jgi:hypothetical protein
MALLLFLGFVLPSAIALLRSRKATTWIIVFNFLLGWTLVGWAVALIWALAGKPAPVSKPRSKAVAAVFRAFVVLGIGSLVTIPFVLPKVSQPEETKTAQNIQTNPIRQQPSPVAFVAQIPAATPSVMPTPTATPEPTPSPTPFAKRAVTYDLEGEKPDKDDLVAMAIIKKMKWSRNGDPVLAAKEDCAEFTSVASSMKSYPNFVVMMSVMSTAANSFDKSVAIEAAMKAKGASKVEIDKATDSISVVQAQLYQDTAAWSWFL